MTIRQRDVYVDCADNNYQYNSRVAFEYAHATMHATKITCRPWCPIKTHWCYQFPLSLHQG